jgi:4-hydroxy-4-methyl-2-oxoglutarate aldolase
VSADAWDRARQLGSATIHEAAGRIGALPSTIGPVDPGMRVAGPAVPVACLPGDNLWIHRAIYAASPNDVLVVATGETVALWGYWGEIMSVAASARRLGGVILQGGSRDSDALARLGFPVFSLGPCIAGTGKHLTSPIGAIGRPVMIGEVVVSSGDLVVGDRDGVVVVPKDVCGAAITAGDDRERTEAAIMERLRGGETTLDIYGLGPS